MDPAAILITSSVVIMFLTLLAVSYKTGFVAYSIWSLTRGDQPKYKINKDKIGRFILNSVCIFILNIAYGLIVVRDNKQIGGILILSLFNTIIIGYGMAFWILLKQEKKT